MHKGQQSVGLKGNSRDEKGGPIPNHLDLLDLQIREPDIELHTEHPANDVWGASCEKGISSRLNSSDAWTALKIRNLPRYPSQTRQSSTDDALINPLCRPCTPASGYTDSGYESQFYGDTRSSMSSSSQGDLLEGCHYFLNLAEARQSIRNNPLACKICPYIAKNPSQKRKHDARHQKPHRCEENGCNVGFGTKNDLERHRKAVHNKSPRHGPIERYKCFGKDCEVSGKVWPRLDNFTAHLKRKHPSESRRDLIDRSRAWFENARKEEAAVDAPGREPTTRKEPNNDNLSLDVNDSTVNTITPSKIWNSPDCYFDVSIGDLQLNQFEGEPVSDMSVSAERAVEPTHASTDTIHPPFPQPHHVTLPGIDAMLKSPVSGEVDGSTRTDKRECTPQQGILPNVQAFDRGIELMQALTVSALPSADILQDMPSMRLPNINQLSHEEMRFCLSMLSRMHSKLILQAPELEVRTTTANDELICASEKGGPKQEGFPCITCQKVFSSASILKKHHKRHVKPYGCTFAGCYGTFGSKADWRRHESMQHCHVKALRCSLPRGKHASCAALFFREEDFVLHLSKCHDYESEDNIQEQIDKSRLGFYDDQCRFYYWCGFCREIRFVEKIGVDACNKRFDHIEAHFSKNENIKRWIPAKGHTMKGARKKIDKIRNRDRKEAPKKPGKRLLEDIDQSHNDNGHDDGEVTVYEVCSSSENESDIEAKHRSSNYNQKHKTRKVNKSETTSYIVFCCHCHDGPLSVTFESCMSCPHKFCSYCDYRPETDLGPIESVDSNGFVRSQPDEA